VLPLDLPPTASGYLQLPMFSLLRTSSRGRRDSRRRSPFAVTPDASRNRVVGRTIDEENADEDYDGEEEDELLPQRSRDPQRSYFDRHVDDYEEEQEEGALEDEDEMETPLLPIFSAAHLDRLPLYNITHTIRLLIIQKCETTLSWDQLRSPQVSQFLVKPIQNEIRSNHFNRATLCALIANCLQFQKEAQLHPSNVGVLRTRALMSELLAMRLVKEFSPRELIDALSYDFDPLQGMSPPTTATAGPQRISAWPVHQLQRDGLRGPKVARVSTIEIAIKAQAKRFLSHQAIVQHLEAIWLGLVVFHSEADNLHRKPSGGEEPHSRGTRYGTIEDHSPSALPADSVLSRKAQDSSANKRTSVAAPVPRRSVTIYDPRDASLFKLSRLRVPRYRQIFSTLSFATMLALFIAVLTERNLDITPLEVVFWFWSAGYMLDEIVGFTEQGFGLYILSFWNAFDLGILMLFVIYYCLRLYGIALAEQGKHRIADAAYDVLASTAILLFPRLFSVLDHYRYFSQLLIAFRMMAQDLMAILVLILISCSGFFVAFTLSFADSKTEANGVVYQLFQILVGFTPAAWEKWDTYNPLGKAIMTVFIIIGHFLIVTILITVLTNSFMAIVQNANEEHQFLFAVNTISMVKSDALFSYVAPTNVIGWMLSPLRYVMPFRQYVKFNRTVIKVTHFPMLFIVFTYERLILSRTTYGPEDLLERRRKPRSKPLAFSINKAPEAFSPGRRLLREPSVASFQDQALDEVFRRPYRGSTVRTTTAADLDGDGRRHSTNAVDHWMQDAENEGGASPPVDQPRSVVDRLENPRPPFRRAATADQLRVRRSRDISAATRSDVDTLSRIASRRPYKISEADEDLLLSTDTLPEETDLEPDYDENAEESDVHGPMIGESALSTVEKENRTPNYGSEDEEFFQTPTAGRSPLMQLSSARQPQTLLTPEGYSGTRTPGQAKERPKGKAHAREISSTTAVHVPGYEPDDVSSFMRAAKGSKPSTTKNTNSGGYTTPTALNALAGLRTPKLKPPQTRPPMPGRQKTAPDITAVGMSFLDMIPRSNRQPSFSARALDLASEIGDNRWLGGSGLDAGGISGMPNSFSEQLLREREMQRQFKENQRREADAEKAKTNLQILSRMQTLEHGFNELIKGVNALSRSNAAGSNRTSVAGDSATITLPTTPKAKSLSGDGKSRKSPKKQDFRATLASELQQAIAGSDIDTSTSPAVDTAENSPDRTQPGSKDVTTEPERPGTALKTPQTGNQSDE
jgi:hypothetical protein